MAVLIDSSPLVAVERGADPVGLAAVVGDETSFISAITVSELLHGVHRADPERATRRRARVEQLLAAFDVIPITSPVARVHADIWSDLLRAGTPIAAHDLWIAATALTHGMGVVTANVRHFERVPGLRVVRFG